jgi:hypothetical protein
MMSVSINLAGEHHDPVVKVLVNDHHTPAMHFAVVELGSASVILPGYDRGAVACMYALSALLELRAQELEAALATDAVEVQAS